MRELTASQDAIIDCAVNLLKSLTGGWLEEPSVVIFEVLSNISDECFTRQHRESVIGFLFQHMKTQAHRTNVTTPSQWRLLLRLTSKLLRRPTFYAVCGTFCLYIFS
jgi:hypothetical protein